MASSCRSRKLWTAEEDQTLREAANEQLQEGGILKDWNRVASSLPGRTNKDSRKRWAKISKEVKKGTWDAEEDARLRQAVERFGTKWTQVAEHVQTRHADQCAKRWTHSLDPEIDHSEWNEGEDERLLSAVGKKGRDWKAIAETEFPGRSKSAIKNRYLVAQNKRRKSSAGTSVLLGVTLVDQHTPTRRASRDDDQMSISEDHFSGPTSANLLSGHEVSSPEGYLSGEQYHCFLRASHDEPGEFPWEELSDLPLWNMEKGCSIEGPPMHHHNGDSMYTDMAPSPFTPSLRNHSTASTDSTGSMMHMEQYGQMHTPYTNSTAQALCITQDDMSANSMLVAYTPPMWNGDSSTSMSSSLRDHQPHPIELISSTACIDPQTMRSGLGRSSKTVLELEDIPQNALYEIMKIAFETKSKVRVETIHQAVSRS